MSAVVNDAPCPDCGHDLDHFSWCGVRLAAQKRERRRKFLELRMDAQDEMCRRDVHPTEGRVKDAYGERCGWCNRRIKL